jgi:hypothetical protein
MTTRTSCFVSRFSPSAAFLILTIGWILVWASAAAAQEAPQTPSDPGFQPDAPATSQAPGQPPDAQVTIPAGTRLALVLTRPLDSKSKRQGDQVFAQTTDPVILNDHVVVPAGTFVQGQIEKLTRKGTRAEMQMQSISLVFPSGYVAKAGGPATIESEQWTAWTNPSGRSKAAMIVVPLVSMPLGALIGSAADHAQASSGGGMNVSLPSHKGLVIGTCVGFVAGLAVAFSLMAHSHQFFMDGGSAMEMALPQPLTLTQAQIDDANHAAATQTPIVPQKRPPAGTQSPVPAGPPATSSPPVGPGSCSAGQEWCQGQCVDSISFVNDSANCGRCGNRCSFNESCTGGFCGCAPGYESCMGQCISSSAFLSDNQNCGTCGRSCSIGESCLGGMCQKIGP